MYYAPMSTKAKVLCLFLNSNRLWAPPGASGHPYSFSMKASLASPLVFRLERNTTPGTQRLGFFYMGFLLFLIWGTGKGSKLLIRSQVFPKAHQLICPFPLVSSWALSLPCFLFPKSEMASLTSHTSCPTRETCLFWGPLCLIFSTLLLSREM